MGYTYTPSPTISARPLDENDAIFGVANAEINRLRAQLQAATERAEKAEAECAAQAIASRVVDKAAADAMSSFGREMGELRRTIETQAGALLADEDLLREAKERAEKAEATVGELRAQARPHQPG